MSFDTCVDSESRLIRGLVWRFDQPIESKHDTGLTNAPASCQALINEALSEGLDTFVVAYLDDILVFSKTREEHVKHVRWVMERLRERSLKLKLEKCEFFKPHMEVLGQMVGNGRLSISPPKVEAIKQIPPPVTKKDLQKFIGCLTYVRKFIPNLASLLVPLYDALKGSETF